MVLTILIGEVVRALKSSGVDIRGGWDVSDVYFTL